jgi:hypothetical protein
MDRCDIDKYFPECESLQDVVDEMYGLLLKYIVHVGYCEGVDFLESFRYDPSLFSKLEWELLEKASEDSCTLEASEDSCTLET